MSSLVLSQVLIVLDFSHQFLVQLHGAIRGPKHALIVE